MSIRWPDEKQIVPRKLVRCLKCGGVRYEDSYCVCVTKEEIEAIDQMLCGPWETDHNAVVTPSN